MPWRLDQLSRRLRLPQLPRLPRLPWPARRGAGPGSPGEVLSGTAPYAAWEAELTAYARWRSGSKDLSVTFGLGTETGWTEAVRLARPASRDPRVAFQGAELELEHLLAHYRHGWREAVLVFHAWSQPGEPVSLPWPPWDQVSLPTAVVRQAVGEAIPALALPPEAETWSVRHRTAAAWMVAAWADGLHRALEVAERPGMAERLLVPAPGLASSQRRQDRAPGGLAGGPVPPGHAPGAGPGGAAGGPGGARHGGAGGIAAPGPGRPPGARLRGPGRGREPAPAKRRPAGTGAAPALAAPGLGALAPGPRPARRARPPGPLAVQRRHGRSHLGGADARLAPGRTARPPGPPWPCAAPPRARRRPREGKRRGAGSGQRKGLKVRPPEESWAPPQDPALPDAGPAAPGGEGGEREGSERDGAPSGGPSAGQAGGGSGPGVLGALKVVAPSQEDRAAYWQLRGALAPEIERLIERLNAAGDRYYEASAPALPARRADRPQPTRRRPGRAGGRLRPLRAPPGPGQRPLPAAGLLRLDGALRRAAAGGVHPDRERGHGGGGAGERVHLRGGVGAPGAPGGGGAAGGPGAGAAPARGHPLRPGGGGGGGLAGAPALRPAPAVGALGRAVERPRPGGRRRAPRPPAGRPGVGLRGHGAGAPDAGDADRRRAYARRPRSGSPPTTSGARAEGRSRRGRQRGRLPGRGRRASGAEGRCWRRRAAAAKKECSARKMACPAAAPRVATKTTTGRSRPLAATAPNTAAMTSQITIAERCSQTMPVVGGGRHLGGEAGGRWPGFLPLGATPVAASARRRDAGGALGRPGGPAGRVSARPQAVSDIDAHLHPLRAGAPRARPEGRGRRAGRSSSPKVVARRSRLSAPSASTRPATALARPRGTIQAAAVAAAIRTGTWPRPTQAGERLPRAARAVIMAATPQERAAPPAATRGRGSSGRASGRGGEATGDGGHRLAGAAQAGGEADELAQHEVHRGRQAGERRQADQDQVRGGAEDVRLRHPPGEGRQGRQDEGADVRVEPDGHRCDDLHPVLLSARPGRLAPALGAGAPPPRRGLVKTCTIKAYHFVKVVASPRRGLSATCQGIVIRLYTGPSGRESGRSRG